MNTVVSNHNILKFPKRNTIVSVPNIFFKFPTQEQMTSRVSKSVTAQFFYILESLSNFKSAWAIESFFSIIYAM
jgi:hypothetical protein